MADRERLALAIHYARQIVGSSSAIPQLAGDKGTAPLRYGRGIVLSSRPGARCGTRCFITWDALTLSGSLVGQHYRHSGTWYAGRVLERLLITLLGATDGPLTQAGRVSI